MSLPQNNPGCLLNSRLLGPTARDSDAIGQGRPMKTYVQRFPGDAVPPDPRDHTLRTLGLGRTTKKWEEPLGTVAIVESW